MIATYLVRLYFTEGDNLNWSTGFVRCNNLFKQVGLTDAKYIDIYNDYYLWQVDCEQKHITALKLSYPLKIDISPVGFTITNEP
jgi:hypothetical protein